MAVADPARIGSGRVGSAFLQKLKAWDARTKRRSLGRPWIYLIYMGEFKGKHSNLIGLWGLMGFTLGFKGKTWWFDGIWGDLMGFNGIYIVGFTLGFKGNTWWFDGISWDFPWDFPFLRDFPWGFMGLNHKIGWLCTGGSNFPGLGWSPEPLKKRWKWPGPVIHGYIHGYIYHKPWINHG